MIAIVDYGAGNLASVRRALEYLELPCEITDDHEVIRTAERVIFPGVGAAGSAVAQLERTGLSEVLKDVIAKGTPFLGICLGFQILFEYSEEDDTQCLGILPGRVKKFSTDMTEQNTDLHLKIPHMGWNEVVFEYEHPIWRDVPEGGEFYFVHSFYAQADPRVVCARAQYGLRFDCGVLRDNVVGVQFHPEKSGRIGLQMLKNFANWGAA
jgi:glutamine amidotransferase